MEDFPCFCFFPTGKKTWLIPESALVINIPLFMIDSMHIFCSDCRISEASTL